VIEARAPDDKVDKVGWVCGSIVATKVDKVGWVLAMIFVER